jgi:hypothetical protein
MTKTATAPTQPPPNALYSASGKKIAPPTSARFTAEKDGQATVLYALRRVTVISVVQGPYEFHPSRSE